MSRKIDDILFELSDLRQIIRIHDKFGTVKKLAQSLKNIIAVISKANKWYGSLYKAIQRLKPSLMISEKDAVFCSKFNSDNYSSKMPPRIREAFQQREQKTRDNRDKFIYQKSNITKMGKRKIGRNQKY